MNNVALVELNNSHSECIYSQVLFLNGEVKNIHLILHPGLEQLTDYKIKGLKRFFISPLNSISNRIRSYLQIRKYILANEIDTIIFNTTTGRFVRELLFFLPKGKNYVGSIHDGRKLVNSSTQKAISRKVKKYFTLNDYVTDYLVRNKITNIKFQSYYPIFFPEIETEKLDKNDSEFWIIIPGKVEQKRRNYFSLIETLSGTNLPSQIKFILLGPSKHFNGDGEVLTQAINNAGLNNNFIIFDNFLSDKVYYSYLKNADMIMPLVEPGNEFYETYKYSQITGAYNIAFGFKIPLLYHEDLSVIGDLKKFGIAYKKESLVKLLQELYEDRANIKALIESIGSEHKFSESYQRKSYLDFIYE